MESEAEKRRQLREARRAKILAAGNARLGKITNTYSNMSKDSLDDVSITHAPDKEINVVQPSDFPGFSRPESKTETIPSLSSSSSSETKTNEPKKEAASDLTHAHCAAEPPRIPFDEKLFADLPAVDVDGDPTLSVPIESSYPDSPTTPEVTIWDWLHSAFVFTLASVCVFQYAIVELLTSGDINTMSFSAIPLKGVCRQIASMATVPVTLTGDVRSSGIFLGHSSVSIWMLFVTMEIALVSARMIFGSSSTRSQGISPILVSFISNGGSTGTTLLQISRIFSTLFMIWKSIPQDILLFVFLIGAAVSGSWVAENVLHVC